MFTDKDEPQHHWGHRICFGGGYSAYFDTNSKQWSSKKEFAALSNEENLEEALFVLNSRIFILLYTGFGGIKFDSLFTWGETERNWLKFNDFQVDPSNNLAVQDDTAHSVLLVAKQEQGLKDSIYLVSNVGDVTRVHHLTVSDQHASLSLIDGLSISDKFRLYTPVTAARWNNNIYIIGGEHGCGFHFQPKKWIHFDLKTNASQVIEMAGNAPPFGFSGSLCTRVLSSGLWVHAAGSLPRGITDSMFSGEVWTVDLKSKPLKWEKSAVVVPEMNSEELIISISDESTIYAADNDKGVFAAKLE